MEKIYDIVILGSGPGGLVAALYAGRYARKTLVIGESSGGVAGKSGDVENWPGIKKISGMELMNNFKEHSQEYGVEFVNKRIKNVNKETNFFLIDLGDEKIKSKSVIFALGTINNKLKIPRENELVGKGVSYCATCDGMFFKGKDVVVIGGADSAAKAAVYLSEICNSVKIVYRGEKLRSEPIYQKRISEKKNINIIYNSVPIEILGENKVEAIKIKDKNERISELKCDGVFIEIGAKPSDELAGKLGIELDEKGYVKVGRDMKTNVLGAFAIGDMTNTPLRQIITSAAEGAVAAHMAHEYLQKNS